MEQSIAKMKNGFQCYNISWTSPSAINAWVYSRYSWVLNYLFNQKTPANAAMKRGIVIESAVASVLIESLTERGAVDAAIKSFDREMIFSNDRNLSLERDSIEPSIKQAVTALSIYGRPDFLPNGKQHKINTPCETAAWSIPILGYLDLVYPQHKLIIDIKTTRNIPKNGITAAHRRQGAIYADAMPGYEVKFQYVSPDGGAIYPVDKIPETFAEVKNIIIDQEKFLASNNDKNALLETAAQWREENEQCQLSDQAAASGLCGAGDQEDGFGRSQGA